MFKDHINLAHNTNLRTIKLNELEDEETFFLPAEERIIPLMDTMVELLSPITSPHVEGVWFIFTMHEIPDLDEVDWSSIEGLLTRPGWALKHLEIDIRGPAPLMSEAEEKIKDSLPVLESRGAVGVSEYYSPYRRHLRYRE
jgi:hypothetical protein